MTATSNPLIDSTPKPPAVLMRDGKWIVGPEQRPKGWEKLPIRDEFREPVTASEPVIKQSLTTQNQPESPAKPETKWGELIATVLALGPKETVDIEVPDGIDRSVFTRNFRAMLSQHTEARHIKWGLYAVYGYKNKINASKSGYWPTYKPKSAKAPDSISPDCRPPEPAGPTPCALKELPPESPVETAGPQPLCACGKPATHRGWCAARSKRSVDKAKEHQDLRENTAKDANIIPEIIPSPEPECKPEPQQQLAEDTSGFSPEIEVAKPEVSTYRCPLEFITDLPVESPNLQEFVAAGLRYWGTLDQVALDEPEWDHYACELLPNLAHEVELYRDASNRATAAVSGWLKDSKLGEWTCDFEEGFQPELRILWAKVQSAILNAVVETEARLRK